MSMVVKNNIAAQMVLGELNKNSTALEKSLKKVSSGQKIVGAKDDASGYSISEKMREQIRSLTQTNQNVQNGMSLLKVADGGITNIVEELRNLKELALNSANDTNTSQDRLTIQKEFTQKMANINDIATTTNYNGKVLLDGSRSKIFNPNAVITQVITTEIVEEKIIGKTEITLTRTNNDPIELEAGSYEITDDGVYMLKDGYTGTLTVKAQNVKFVQESSGVLKDVYITGPEGGNANLWIEGLNIQNTQDKNFIKFQGANNFLNFKGTNNFSTACPTREVMSAIINVGEGLTVEGGSDGSGVFNFNAPAGDTFSQNYQGAFIGSDNFENSSTDIVVNSGNFNSYAYRGGAAFIGSGSNGNIGNINIYGGTFRDLCDSTGDGTGDVSDALIGGGNTFGNITIDNAVIYIKTKGYEPGIGISNGDNTIDGDIYISNSSIYFRGQRGSAIGTDGYNFADDHVEIGDITIENCLLDIQVTEGGAGIGSGKGGICGDIKIIKTDLSNVIVTGGGEQVGKGFNGECGTVDLSQAAGFTNIVWHNVHSGKTEPENSSQMPLKIVSMTTEKTVKTITQTIQTFGAYEFNPVQVQFGANANQAINLYIEDLHTKSLGAGKLIDGDGNFVLQEDKDRFDALSYDADLQAAWKKTVTAASEKTLDDISIATKYNANIAVRILDGAIDYALNQSIHVGADLQRMEYTGSNITTMTENVQAAESTIRDADMAKEMTNYTKANILLQSAQSMLAQANQNFSAVLSLLQ